MSAEFSIGDMVRLNSGGPVMTVTDIETDTDTMAGEATICSEWFDSSGNKHKDQFPPASLTKVK